MYVGNTCKLVQSGEPTTEIPSQPTIGIGAGVRKGIGIRQG